jgi:GT2 family glycosyltransferase
MTTVDGTPRIAIVMLTFNGGQKTLDALASLAEHESGIPIVLWDNGSSDDTADRAAQAYPAIQLHRHPSNLGVAGGRNAAAALAIATFTPTHLLFLDDDLIVRPGFVKGLLDPLQADAAIGQAQAKLLFLHDPTRINDAGGCHVRFWLGTTAPVGIGELDQGQYDTPQDCVACGGAMMVRVDVFQALGGFDEGFNPFGPEDIDFSMRLKKAGWRAVYCPDAVALHAVSGTFEGGKQSAVYTQKRIVHWLVFLRRHGSPAQQLAFFLVGVPFRAVRLTWRAVRSGNPGILLGMMRSVMQIGGDRKHPARSSATKQKA